MNVVIRTDASYTIGSGHVMRCLTLARGLKNHQAHVTFFCREGAGNLISVIEEAGFVVERLSSCCGKDDALRMRTWLQERETDWLVVDHYELDITFDKVCRPYVKKIMVIDDLGMKVHDCDILLNQNILDDPKDYSALLPTHARRCIGSVYTLLRDGFYHVKRRKRDGRIHRILLFFGGSDPTCETEKAIFALIGMDAYIDNQLQIDVVVGKNNPKRIHLSNLCSVFPNMTYYEQVPNLEELMNEADLMIGSGGTTTWERCYLGVPALTVSVAQNQYANNERVHQLGGHCHLGWYNDVEMEQIQLALEDLLQDPKAVTEMSQNSFSVMKGHERQKIISVMKEVLA